MANTYVCNSDQMASGSEHRVAGSGSLHRFHNIQCHQQLHFYGKIYTFIYFYEHFLKFLVICEQYNSFLL